MAEEKGFSLGDLDEVPNYEQVEQDSYEQEELHPENVTEISEEPDSEEYSEDEEYVEESEYEEEVGEDDDISYTPFLLPLVEEGILWVDPEKEYDDSPEGAREVFIDNANHVIDEVISQLPEVLQHVFELAQLGEDPRAAFENLNTFDYSQVDLEDVDTQKELTKDYYRERLGWSEDKLAKHIQNLEDLGELEDESRDAQSYFIEKTEAEKEAYIENVRTAREEAIIREQEEVEHYRQIIEESEGFAGINFTSNRQKAEFERYCFERGPDGLTEYERDSKEPVNALTLAFYKFNNFGFESVQKKARTDAYVEQKKVLRRVADKNAESKNMRGRTVSKPRDGFHLGNV